MTLSQILPFCGVRLSRSPDCRLNQRLALIGIATKRPAMSSPGKQQTAETPIDIDAEINNVGAVTGSDN